MAGFWLSVLYAYYHFPALSRELGDFIYFVIAGAVVIFVVGLADDVSDLSAPAKLAGQTLAGLIVCLGGLKISVIFVPTIGQVDLGVLSLPITLVWLVGVMNSINLIDGLDGLAAGVSALAALALLFVGITFGLVAVVVFSLAIIGACLAFLYFNHYPAKIFMGDSGSLFLGYLFAVISIIFPIKSYTTAAIFIPLAALGVPIVETVVSFFRRVFSGREFYKADNRHLFHYLAATGLSKQTVVWTFYILSALFAVLSGAMIVLSKRLLITILVVFMVVIFAILLRFRLTRSRNLSSGKQYD